MVDVARGMVRFAILSCVVFVSGISAANQLMMIRDQIMAKINSFEVYWNVPTFLCNKHKVDFESELKKFGIITNPKVQFRGEKISILYDPGLFSKIVEDKGTGQLKEVNGGVPQKGDLQVHLQQFRKDMNKLVPENFNGLGIIDFESWVPFFRQHLDEQMIYKNKSLELVRKEHPDWPERRIQQRAKEDFERAAKVFMEETLKEAKRIRPNGKWGYYGFPYCLNYEFGNSANCPREAKRENTENLWLYRNSQAFYPALYSNKNLTAAQHKDYVIARMNEASRMAASVSKKNPPPIFPFVWYRHLDEFIFLTPEIMNIVLETTKQYQMGGALIWGSSADLKTAEQCKTLKNYLTNVLGPIVQKIKG